MFTIRYTKNGQTNLLRQYKIKSEAIRFTHEAIKFHPTAKFEITNHKGEVIYSIN